MHRPIIGILGHYGNQNLGDEAIIASCVQRIPEHVPDVKLRLFSSKPQDSETRYKLPAYPIRYILPGTLTSSEQFERERRRSIDHTGQSAKEKKQSARIKTLLKKVPFLWSVLRALRQTPHTLMKMVRECQFLWRSWKHVKSLDLLVIAGSNQFLDNFGGPWGFPYTLLKWTWLARSAGTAVAYVSVGAGPLDAALSHRMIHMALKHVCYLSFRDEASRQMVDPDQKFNGKVFPDLAFAIDYPHSQQNEPSNTGRKPIVAINVMAVYDARYWYIKDPVRYRVYVDKMADFVVYLLQKNYDPQLFATQVKDENVIRDIEQALISKKCDASLVASLFHQNTSVNELLVFLQHVDVVVPTRFHGTVLGLWACKPTIGICYYRKAADLLAEFGQQDYAFEIDTVTVSELCEAVENAWANQASITRRIRQQVDEYRNLLLRQFITLNDLLPSRLPL